MSDSGPQSTISGLKNRNEGNGCSGKVYNGMKFVLRPSLVRGVVLCVVGGARQGV